MTEEQDPAALAAEVERLRAERDQLAAERDARLRGGIVRRGAVVGLVVFSCLAFLVASLAFWTNRNLLETDVWVERVGPLAEDPAVQAALSEEITDQVMELVDPESLLREVLPERGEILAVPLTGALRSFVEGRVQQVVESEQFAQLWVAILERGHEGAVGLLRGEDVGQVIATERGSVVVSIIPAIDAVLQSISKVSPELFGTSVELPALTVDDVPAEATAKLEDALGIELDDDFGAFTVYRSDDLSLAQDAIKVFDRLLVASILLTVVGVAAALALTRRRRRTGLQLLVGFALVLVLIRRVTLRLTEDVLDLIELPGKRAAVDSILSAFVDPLLGSTEWILLALLVAVVALVVTGPYPPVVAARQRLSGAARSGAAAAEGFATDDATLAWVREHAVALQWAGGGVLLAALWFWDLSWLGLLVLAALIGAFELYVNRVASDRPGPEAVEDATP